MSRELFLFKCKGDIMNWSYDKEIGNRIKIFREQVPMTQDQLAAKLQTMGCDITRSCVAKIEVGQRHIYLDELKCIKEILKVSFEDLFYGK